MQPNSCRFTVSGDSQNFYAYFAHVYFKFQDLQQASSKMKCVLITLCRSGYNFL